MATDELDPLEELEALGESDSVSESAGGLDPDHLIDQLIPDAIDWRELVGSNPMLAVGGLGLLGFFIGRTKGAALMSGAAAAVSATMTRQLADVFDGEYFDLD